MPIKRSSTRAQCRYPQNPGIARRKNAASGGPPPSLAQYRLDDVNQAAEDLLIGAAVKPVLIMR
jgi:hypothetical protein